MLDWKQCSAIEQTAEKVSGAWLFKGTRVPVKALFENLGDGATVQEFLKWFPGVSREQIMAVLEFAEHSVDLMQFAGVLRLTEDPLDWQCLVRAEWE